VRSLPAYVRPWPYVVCGGLVGFLLLTEFAMITLPVVQLALLGLAVVALFGALRRRTALGLWSLFVVAALIVPLISDSHVVGLPRCGAVAPGVACLGGTRDVVGQFAVEVLIFGLGIAGSLVWFYTSMLSRRAAERDN
jgi:hypothetical protein